MAKAGGTHRIAMKHCRYKRASVQRRGFDIIVGSTAAALDVHCWGGEQRSAYCMCDTVEATAATISLTLL